MTDTSKQTLYQEITDQLKTVPKEVLERISAYLSEIDENKEHINQYFSERNE